MVVVVEQLGTSEVKTQKMQSVLEPLHMEVVALVERGSASLTNLHDLRNLVDQKIAQCKARLSEAMQDATCVRGHVQFMRMEGCHCYAELETNIVDQLEVLWAEAKTELANRDAKLQIGLNVTEATLK